MCFKHESITNNFVCVTRGTLPWEEVKRRRREGRERREKSRNMSIVSRVYENNIAGDGGFEDYKQNAIAPYFEIPNHV